MPSKKVVEAVEAPKKISAKKLLAEILTEVAADIDIDQVKSADGQVDFDKVEELYNNGQL